MVIGDFTCTSRKFGTSENQPAAFHTLKLVTALSRHRPSIAVFLPGSKGFPNESNLNFEPQTVFRE